MSKISQKDKKAAIAKRIEDDNQERLQFEKNEKEIRDKEIAYSKKREDDRIAKKMHMERKLLLIKNNSYLSNLYDRVSPFSKKFINFLEMNNLEIFQDFIIHRPTYLYTIQQVELYRDKIPKNIFSSEYSSQIKKIEEEVSPEDNILFLEFLNTFSDDNDIIKIPPGRDHIFKEFKNELEQAKLLKLPIDGFSKIAIYYILIYEVIEGLRIQRLSAISSPSILMAIDTHLSMAKFLAILWIAIVIEDSGLSEVIHYYYEEKKGEYIMNYLVPLLGFAGNSFIGNA